MPRTCTICRHPRRREIDKAILDGESVRDIAGRVPLSKTAIQRHKPHVAPIVARAFERRQDQFGENLVAELQRLATEAADIGAEAKRARQYGAAMGGVREMTRICELIAKLTGQLDEGSRVAVVIQEREARVGEQSLMLERLTLDERAELRRLVEKAQGGGDAVEVLAEPPTVPIAEQRDFPQ